MASRSTTLFIIFVQVFAALKPRCSAENCQMKMTDPKQILDSGMSNGFRIFKSNIRSVSSFEVTPITATTKVGLHIITNLTPRLGGTEDLVYCVEQNNSIISDNLRHLDGFLVLIVSSNSGNIECILSDISGSGCTTAAITEHELLSKCVKCQYEIRMMSLPCAMPSDNSARVIVRLADNDNDCSTRLASCWKTDVIVYVRDKTVRVVFWMAPDEAIITSYLVVLRISGSLSSDDHGHIAHVSSGNMASVVLKVSGQSPLTKRIVAVRPGGEICALNSCRETRTLPFDITTPSEAGWQRINTNRSCSSLKYFTYDKAAGKNMSNDVASASASVEQKQNNLSIVCIFVVVFVLFFVASDYLFT